MDLDGWSPTFVSCELKKNDSPHLYVRVDDWALDPTAEQFGARRPLAFRIGSRADAVYEAGPPWTLSEAEIVENLADEVAWQLPHPEGDDWRSATLEALLTAVGLARKIPLVSAAAEARAAELRADYPMY